jgi:hypothetical protein
MAIARGVQNVDFAFAGYQEALSKVELHEKNLNH